MIENLDEVIEALGGEVRAHIAKEIAGVKADHAIEVADLRSKLSLAITLDEFDRRTVPLFEKIAELETRAATPGPRGADGLDGKAAEVDYDRIGNVIATAVEKEVGKFPTPRDGRDGKDGTNGKDGKDGAAGRDADHEVIVARVLERMPKPENGKDGSAGRDGKDGRDGVDGKDGMPGKDGIDGAVGEKGDPGRDGVDGKDGIAGSDGKHGTAGVNGRDADEDAIVRRVVASIPVPRDGIDGKEGPKGDAGRDVHLDTVRVLVRDAIEDAVPRVVAMIPKAQDGKSVDPAEVARLVGSEVTRQLTELAPYIKGDPGDDGLGFDDLSVSDIDGDGMVTLKFSRGERVRELKVGGFPHYVGVHVRGREERKGAIAVYGGSAFIAVRDTSAAIGTDPPSPDWSMIVKRGRDGRD